MAQVVAQVVVCEHLHITTVSSSSDRFEHCCLEQDLKQHLMVVQCPLVEERQRNPGPSGSMIDLLALMPTAVLAEGFELAYLTPHR